MHIPDGYLSPSTCACLYAASTPFWYVSLKRLKNDISSRSVPLLSVFAAFSFVVMMFNLPLPGGTTGHAVGMAIASVVLGPAISILAISIALLVQALFFGDGGVTTFGANCFNMAIVGSLSAFAIYRAIAWRADLTSARRVLAAGLAGYGAINLSALFAAIEFGIQPIYFHDVTGAPLYAPYPLGISIPAMMIGHLTVAGSAEFIISSGLVRYLQRSDPEMLRTTAPDAPQPAEASRVAVPTKAPFALWAGLAILLLLTPVGILAVGSAWGEWSPEEIGSPRGMQGLHSLWNAPLSGYAPRFVSGAPAGYLVSAFIGVCLILIAAYLLRRVFTPERKRRSFVETSIRHLIVALQKAFLAEDASLSTGLLQTTDPRVKLAGFAALLMVALATRYLIALVVILLLSIFLAQRSHVSIRLLFMRAWVAVLVFTGMVALPALFVTPGHAIYQLPILQWTMTAQGLRTAAFLLMRSEVTATLALLLTASTPWSHLMRALRWFRMPSVAVVVIGMTYRYIFVFLQTAHSMLESRQTKLVGRLPAAEQRRLAASSIGVLLDKSLHLSTEVHVAMQARGYRGEVYILEDLQMKVLDWCQLAAVLLLALAVLQIGR